MTVQETIVQTQDPVLIPEIISRMDNILEMNRTRPGGLMVILNEIQSLVGYISLPMQQYIADQLQIPASQVHGVVTFYSFFTTSPRGKHVIKFCMGTACYVGGTQQLLDKAKQLFGVEAGNTTPDGKVTLELCRCVGACSQAPVIVVDEEIIGRMKPNKFPQAVKHILDETTSES